MKERRKHKRFEILQMVDVSFGKEEFIASTGLNISEGGLLCKTDSDIETYAKIFLMIGLPLEEENHQIKFDGMVVRSSKVKGGYEVGISITDIPPEDLEKLKAYLATLDKK